MSLNLQAEPIDACLLLPAPKAKMSQKFKPVKSVAGPMSSADHHPLSPLEQDSNALSACELLSNDSLSEDYFNIQVKVGGLSDNRNSKIRPATTSNDTTSERPLPPMISSSSDPFQSPIRSFPGSIPKTSLKGGKNVPTNRMRLIRDDTIRQIPEVNRDTDHNQVMPNGLLHSSSPQVASFNEISVNSSQKNHISQRLQALNDLELKKPFSSKLKVSLSCEPHLIYSDEQLLRELGETLNSRGGPFDFVVSQPHELRATAINQLMMGVIRELSSRLQTLQKDYNTTRLEANGLKSLLVDNYSVGPGEIDRCLVRSRCQNESSKESSTQVRSSGLRWEVEVNDWEYSQDLNTNCGNLSTGTSAALSSGSANKLDLEDLREAMSENPYFEATSQSSCRSRSLVTSPGSATSPLPSSPGRALNHDVSRSGSSSIRLFNPTNILSSKYRKSGNGPSLPSNVAATQGKDSNSSLPTSPNHSTKNPHKRNPSVGSNLSAASSQNNGIGFRNGNWGFYGWKWHKRGKPAGSLATSAAGDLDGEEQLDCDEERNQVSDQELNLGLSSEGADQTGESSQLEAVNRPKTPGSAADAPSPPILRSSSTDGSSGATLLTGLLESINRTKRKGSVNPRSQQPPITNTLNCNINGPSTQTNSHSHGSPNSINVTSSLATNRSSSLLLGSLGSATTETTSANSTSSADESCLTQQTRSSGAVLISGDNQTVDAMSLLPTPNFLEIESQPRTTPLDTPNRSSAASSTLSSSVNSLLLPPPCLASSETHASLEEMEELISTACATTHSQISYRASPCLERSSSTATSLAQADVPLSSNSGIPPASQDCNQDIAGLQSRRASSTNSKSPAHIILSSSKCLPAVATQTESVALKESSFKQSSCKSDINALEVSPLSSPGVRETGTSRTMEDILQKAGEVSFASRKLSSQFIITAEPQSTIEKLPQKKKITSESSKDLLKSNFPKNPETNRSSSCLGPSTKSSSVLAKKASKISNELVDSRLTLLASTPATSSSICSSNFLLPQDNSSIKKAGPQSKVSLAGGTKSHLSTAQVSLGKVIGLDTSSVGLQKGENIEPNVTTVPSVAFGRGSSISTVVPIASSSSMVPSKTSVTNVTASTLIFSGSQRGQLDSYESLTPILDSEDPIPKKQNNFQNSRVDQIFLPPLSHSTMELSTFTNPQSNPPALSIFGHKDESKSSGVSVDLRSTTLEQIPITDRFGFIVDVKYGLKLMRESRDRKKKLLSQETSDCTLGPSGAAPRKASDEPDFCMDSSVLESLPKPCLSDLNLPLENHSRPGVQNETATEGTEIEQSPVLTTALPIKSQVDVEAELASLREALGLPPPVAEDGSKGKASSRTPTIDQNSYINGEVEQSSQRTDDPTTQSIKRLLSQLNDAQNIMEQSRLRAWTQFIAKRKSKLAKTSFASINNHLGISNSNVSIGMASFGNVTEAQSNKKAQGNGIVSPQSVGAFLGLGKSLSNGGGTPVEASTTAAPARGHGPQSSTALQQGNSLDLITCHDGNLIGIASMGLSIDNGKIALRDDWKDFRNLVKRGVPISLRPKIWLESSGASDLKEPGYYEDLLNLHKDEGSMCLNQIECDVTRTLPTNVYFGGDGPGVSKLRRVLAAMSWHNPRVGYCQGMNMVAATLLLTIPSEEDAFWVLVCIVDKILPPDYYTSHLLTSQADQRVLRDLVEKYLPDLWCHFDSLEVELPAITFGWFLSLFADALPIQTLLRVFDLFLIDGCLLLFRVALALLKLNKSTILSHDSPASLYAYMRGPMTLSSHHADRIIDVATEQFKEVKNKQIATLREKHVADLKAEMGIE